MTTDDWEDIVHRDLEAHRSLLGYEETDELTVEEKLDHRLMHLELCLERTRLLERSLLQVVRHYEAVQERVDRVLEKSAVDARDQARGLASIEALTRASCPRAAEWALDLLAGMQRLDVHAQELADISRAVREMIAYLDDADGTLHERLVHLPTALEALLPRKDIDAREVPAELGGPSVEIF